MVTELLANQAATVVRDQSEMRDFVQQCLDDCSTAESAGSRAQQVVLKHAGASARTVDAILGLVQEVGAQGQPIQISDAA